MNLVALFGEDGDGRERPDGQGKRSTRRTFIKTGIALAGGIIVGGEYVKPTLRSITTNVAQAFSPAQSQGSIEVDVSITSVELPLDGSALTGEITGVDYVQSPANQSISGTMHKSVTITNVSREYVPVKVIWVHDYVEYRLVDDGGWRRLADYYNGALVTTPALLNDEIYDPKSETYAFDLPFTVPHNTSTLRNTIEIKLENQNPNKDVFFGKDSFEFPREQWKKK